MIKKSRSIIYRFVWNEQKVAGWKHMARPKKEGGITLKDPKLLNQTVAMKRLVRLWTAKDSVWVTYWTRIRIFEEELLLI